MTEEQIETRKSEATILRMSAQMYDMNATDRACYLLISTIEAIREKGSGFSIKDAINLKLEADDHYPATTKED